MGEPFNRELFVKKTLRGTGPDAGAAENAATGGESADTKFVLIIVLLPAVVNTVKATVY